MGEVQAGQFGVLLSDGMRVDRLPVGWAAGHWWIEFIFSGVDFDAGRPRRGGRMWEEIPDLLRLEHGGGRDTIPLTACGDGGFGGDAYWAQYQFSDDLSGLTISYLEAGATVATEQLELV